MFAISTPVYILDWVNFSGYPGGFSLLYLTVIWFSIHAGFIFGLSQIKAQFSAVITYNSSSDFDGQVDLIILYHPLIIVYKVEYI